MATIIDPPNSVWPNGLKVDSEGYVTFYPLGTNKVDISTVTWPKGNKVISPFVYDENDKLVGFIDTKALIANSSNSTTFPYDYVNIQVDKSLEGVMTFNKGERTKYLIITYSYQFQ